MFKFVSEGVQTKQTNKKYDCHAHSLDHLYIGSTKFKPNSKEPLELSLSSTHGAFLHFHQHRQDNLLENA